VIVKEKHKLSKESTSIPKEKQRTHTSYIENRSHNGGTTAKCVNEA
jgi:hypothetical protein